MKKTFSNILFFVSLIALFVGALIANNSYLQNINVDLTQEKIYSLSDGSQQIAANIKRPISLRLFFSENNSSGMTVIREYKARVESLLKEYQRLSNGKISLEVIDTESFSEAEDQAASFGLTAAGTGVGQDTIYFGLAGTTSLGDELVIGFFDPQKEAFLEYDISSLLYQLNDPEPVHLTIVTDLPIAGGSHPLNGQATPAFALYQQLDEMFDVSLINSSDKSLPDNTQLLLLWHPQNLDESLLLSIDQYLMNSGKALAMLDAHYESDPIATVAGVDANSSSLELLTSYGINYDSTQIVLDALTGLEVRNPQGGTIRHLGFLGLNREQINENDITTSDLDSINGASFGTVEKAIGSSILQTTLLTSSLSSGLIPSYAYTAIQDPAMLANKFTIGNKLLTLAARFSGPAKSHFADQHKENAKPIIMSTNNLNLVVIADADLAADRFWVQQGNFFGQAVLSTFADNGDFIVNTLENLSGSENLIGIRSRGTYARPFIKVQALQVVAEEKFREQEQRLLEQLEQTETQLLQLQPEGESLSLTSEQEAAIKAFTEQKITIRKSLRDVQFQLQKDINELGDFLKVVNIVAAPLALVILLYLLSIFFSKRAPN